MYYIEYDGAIILSVSGRDSTRYLNARLTNDIRGLSLNHAIVAAALNHHGRTEGLFTVLKINSEEYLLVCDGGDPIAVMGAFKRYIVADRVSVRDLSGERSLFHVISSTPTPLSAAALPQENLAFTHERWTIIRRRRLEIVGFDIIVPAAERSEFLRVLTENHHHRMERDVWNLQRLSGGVPEFPTEVNEDRLFAEAQLQDAVSFTKGCYVGQEVVEKIDSHGKVPSVLRRLVLSRAVDIRVDTDVRNGEAQKVGSIISSATDKEADVTYCFAIIKNDPRIQSSPIFVAETEGRISDV